MTGDDAAGGRDLAAVPAGPVAPEDPWVRADRWTSRLLLLLGVLALLAALLVAPGLVGPAGRPVVVTVVVGSILASAALLYATSIAVDRGLPWGRVAATWLLVTVIVQGLVDLAVGLAGARLTIPLGAILAGYALSLRPGPLPPVPGAAVRLGRLVGVVALALALLPGAAVLAVTDARSPLVASPDDLAVTLAVDCGPAGGGTPDVVRARVAWTWTGRDLAGSAPDAVGIGWSSGGGDAAFTLREDATSSDAVWSGGDGAAAGVVERRLATMPGWTWAVDGEGAMADGWAEVVLERETAAPTFLDLYAVYAHGDRWDVGAQDGCEW